MVDRDTAETETRGPTVASEDAGPVPPIAETPPQPQPAEAQPVAATSPNEPAAATDKNAGAGAWFRANWVPLLLVVLTALTVCGIVVGLTSKQDDAFGKFCIIAAVPLLSIAIGFFGNRFFSDVSARETLRKDVQMAAYTTCHLQSSVVYVDERVGYARALATGISR